MTHWRSLFFQCVLIQFLVFKGETCSFKETPGQKGMESLRSNSGSMTADVAGCKTLCNVTELCVAGEFLSSTSTCYMYSLETSLTAQSDVVFFQWDCTNESAVSDDDSVVPIVVGAIAGGAVVGGVVIAAVVLSKRCSKKSKTDTELQGKPKVNDDAENKSLTGDK